VSRAVSSGSLSRSGASLITVGMALRLSSLRRGAPRVVAGSEHLDRPVRWVHSSEVPHIATLLKGDELLLLTGMGIARSAESQRRFVRDLDERGVAGVVVELGHVFERLPATLVSEARARGLPLIELHREVPFVDVTEELHSNIVNRQVAVLRRADELHRRFTQLLLDGSGIPEILGVLALAIANPVLLEPVGQGVLYHAAHRTPPDVVEATWADMRAAVEADPAAAGEAIVLPVPTAGRRTWGRLIALPLDSPLDDFDRVAVERALPLVALVLVRRHQEALLAARDRGNFLEDVAAGRLSAADARARAQALGFDAARTTLVPVAATAVAPAGAPAITADETDWAPVWRATRDELERHGLPTLIGARGRDGEALFVLAVPRRDAREDAVELLAGALRDAFRRHIGPPDLLTIAAGAAVPDWGALPAALREAMKTAATAAGAAPRRWHDATSADLERLLWSLRHDERLDDFVARRLGPVLDHDRRRTAVLMPTLEALCDHGWRKAEAARALNLNRQSLYARIARLEALLGADLDSVELRLGVELAVRYRRGDR
jgi:PucR family transcriptional regulator, purine catabolism regulatory protein